MDKGIVHRPVLLERCLALARPALEHRGAVAVDCTLGLAGHATAFLKSCPEARLIGIDRDRQALDLATGRMRDEGLADRFTPVHAPFDQLDEQLDALGVGQVDLVFMDLGLSSLQIDQRDRGFTYRQDAPLDMRMDTGQELTAAQILAEYDQERLADIFSRYGEERYAGRIARAIVEARRDQPLTTSAQLDRLVDMAVPRGRRPPGNPAKRVFQALRIEVNGELDRLRRTLPQAVLRLAQGGRLVVESYHSLEDRMVKRFMASGLHVDLPAGMPVVPDQARPYLSDLTHGAIKADSAERERNPRSASVRLRAVERIGAIPEERRRRLQAEANGESSDRHHRHVDHGFGSRRQP
ncbi:16S rRNA (cytosine(1402)-N(4))-methyltransferase [Bifidobacterium asteroides]|uniref:Ribosomal RNA small subunit methyltransferase H n=1 Tax=Bifidobacterium asteroides TaxID=1684 RepID=A0A318M991_9BIFI|nr:16S rRNA (cytosine(1402)-N(4))-methyltransferase [Bifidobacterium asteroides]